MLTNTDLRKIGEIIDIRLEIKLGEKLEEFEEKLETKLEEELRPIKKDIKSLKNGHRNLRKDLNIVLKHLDEARAQHEKRITRIEDCLDLSPME